MCVRVCACVCVCVCVLGRVWLKKVSDLPLRAQLYSHRTSQRERERERGTETETEGERERERNLFLVPYCEKLEEWKWRGEKRESKREDRGVRERWRSR